MSESRSVQKRVALQKGEPMPKLHGTFTIVDVPDSPQATSAWPHKMPCDCVIHRDQPQAASDGALSVEPVTLVEADYFVAHETSYTQYLSGAWGWSCACGESDQFGNREDCIERTRDHWAKCLNALLAAHDQKVRDDATLTEHQSHVEFESELYATLVDPVAEGSIKEAEMRKQLLEQARWYRQRVHDLTDFTALLKAADDGLKTWAATHPKWWKRIDGTPIPNDLLVNIVQAIRALAKRAEEESKGIKG